MRGWPKTLESAREAARKLLCRTDGMTADRQYTSGGYIGPPVEGVPILLSPGHAFVTTAQVNAVGGMENLRNAFPNMNFELLITADEARSFGAKFLDDLIGKSSVVGRQPDQHGDDLGLVDPPVQPPTAP